jgi:hypothetical protein
VTDSFSTPPQPSSAPNPFGPGPDLAPPPAPVVPPNAKPRGRGGRIVNIVLALAVAVAIAGVAFAVGRGTANASTPQNTRGQFFNGQGFPGNGNGNGGNGNGGNGDEREAERGLRGLVGSGASQVGLSAAMRARDAARPNEDELAAAERDLVIVRRGWVPREDLPRTLR